MLEKHNLHPDDFHSGWLLVLLLFMIICFAGAFFMLWSKKVFSELKNVRDVNCLAVCVERGVGTINKNFRN